MVSVAERRTLWTGKVEESFARLFELEDALAEQVAVALAVPLNERNRRQLKKDYTQNIEAYQLYQKGRYFWNRRTPEALSQGIECFEQALKLDPSYALAWAGLADSYALTISGLAPLERLPKAKAAAQRALELDAELAEAHASLGFVKYKFEWDWRGAEGSFRRAIELNPNYATAHHWLGEFLGLLGRFDEGLVELRRAERLDPFSLAIKEDIGVTLYRSRQYDQALEKLREVIMLDPHFVRARRTLGYV